MIGTRRFGMLLHACMLVLIVAMLLVSQSAEGAIVAPRSVTVKHERADRHQRVMIGRVLTACQQLKAGRVVLIASIATITQESNATNLTGGHGTSVGLFQIIDVHGSWRQRHTPEWSARWFCARAINVAYHRPYLTVAALAQAVQRSAHPTAYGRWTREAVRTYRLTLRRA